MLTKAHTQSLFTNYKRVFISQAFQNPLKRDIYYYCTSLEGLIFILILSIFIFACLRLFSAAVRISLSFILYFNIYFPSVSKLDVLSDNGRRIPGLSLTKKASLGLTRSVLRTLSVNGWHFSTVNYLKK